MGQPAQHLLVKINVEDKLVELHFMFTKADFSLHIRTDDASLREGLAYSQSYAHTALLKAGWEISQFSVGKLAETRGEL